MVVTCFNKKEFIPEFRRLTSELLDSGFEIVVVDDGSTDGSTQLLENLAVERPQIQFYPLAQNVGSADARNRGIKACKRSYIFFLDIDDTCNPITLKESVLELASRKCDFLIANLATLPQNQLLEMPASVPIGTEFEMKAIASRILETAGYSRYIYSRKFISKSSFRFFPTRSEFEFRNFILDDAFWLLLISASKACALVCEKKRIIYYYNRPVSTLSAWNFYLNQIQLVPNLILLFLSNFVENNFVDKKVLIENSTRWMFQVLRPLNLTRLIASDLFAPKTITTLHRYFRLVGTNYFILAKLYFHAFFVALKNSLRIRTRIGLITYP